MSLEPRSCILTSGTLTPMDAFERELQVSFKYKLENQHVIDMDQVMISILSKGFMGDSLNYSYKTRNNHVLLDELAVSLKKISEATSGGILVFFPSYSAL